MNCDGAANEAVFANSGIATVVLPLEVTTTRIGSIWRGGRSQVNLRTLPRPKRDLRTLKIRPSWLRRGCECGPSTSGLKLHVSDVHRASSWSTSALRPAVLSTAL